MHDQISASEALYILASRVAAPIDVRSEGEFKQASIPGFVNLPILRDDERHQVGITYKTSGEQAAVALGHKLVEADKRARIAAWCLEAQRSPHKTALIACWRGGLRSKLASEAISSAGLRVLQVTGGYHAMRQELLSALQSGPPLIVLAGMTGSRKTRFIRTLPAGSAIDLEAMAEHRGSSFGGHRACVQPTQGTFENRLGLAIKLLTKEVLIEDESRGIGFVNLPMPFMNTMRQSNVIVISSSLEERALAIYTEYIADPLADGVLPDELAEQACVGVLNIRKRLGGALTEELLIKIKSAFSGTGANADEHQAWIRLLLEHYYDKVYAHSSARWNRPILFQGDYNECYQWISHRFDSQNP